MIFKTEEIEELIKDLQKVLKEFENLRQTKVNVIDKVLPFYKQSAENLVSYLAFRKKDRTDIQKKLGSMGLSRLARAEAHIGFSVLRNYDVLNKLSGKAPISNFKPNLTIENASDLLDTRTTALLGKSGNSRLRIMVTIPSDAADNKEMIIKMIENGMGIARINCAHDNPEGWKKMISNIREASREMGTEVKIAMDLGGPKLRTGSVQPGPKIVKVSPEKNYKGDILKPAVVPVTIPEYLQDFKKAIAVRPEDLFSFKVGQIFKFKDSRGKKRKMRIDTCNQQVAFGSIYKTAYIDSNVIFKRKKDKIKVAELTSVEQFLYLRSGDMLHINLRNVQGTPAHVDANGKVTRPASISISEDEIFKQVKKGENIFFDDGKIKGVIRDVDDSLLKVEIIQSKDQGAKLKSDKGINFPDSKLDFKGMTVKDRKDLKFVIKYADIVNVSFVNTASDIEQIHTCLDELNAPKDFGVVLKIETQHAYNNFTDLLLAAMKRINFGVMIARGDLAIETGWETIGIVQKEIITLCNAAHVPVIWATQVLENLAKKGLPSRSEITDSVNALKADCIMLNKGPHILKAIRLLNEITTNMDAYQNKNAPLLPGLHRI